MDPSLKGVSNESSACEVEKKKKNHHSHERNVLSEALKDLGGPTISLSKGEKQKSARRADI